MSLFQSFRSSARSATPTPARQPPPRLVVAAPPLEAIALEARALAKAWHPAERRLAVITPSPVGRGRRVVVNVSGVGVIVGLTGVVAAVRAVGATCHAEVTLDQDQLPVVERILGVLQGDAEALRARPPRYSLALPAFVSSEAGHTYMTTFSVSQAGCGISWSGPPPQPGRGVLVRLGSGSRAPALRAMVCWVRSDARGVRAGLRFLAGDEAKLAGLLGDATRGAPSAP